MATTTTTTTPTQRRVQVLTAHLTSALPNNRPGDGEANPVPTSFFVSGSFAPRSDEKVQRVTLSQSILKGHVTPDLQRLLGTFLRIGPNPKYSFEGKPYHVFDGDGMIHSIQFHGDDTLTYTNKYIQTEAYKRDAKQDFSFSIMGEAMEITNTASMAWTQFSRGPMGRANTAMVHHNGKLLALFEQDVPYAVNPTTLETLEKINDFGTAPFTAHPKVCPATQDMIYFGYINGKRKGPFCHYGVCDKHGKVVTSFPVTLPHPVMMHDVAITATRSILFDYNLRYHSPKELMTGQATSMYQQEPNLPSRFGVLPRHAASDAEIVWIEVPSAIVFHFLNAWDEGEDEVVVWGCASSSLDLDNLGGDTSQTSGGIMTCWKLNVKTGKLVDTYVVDTPKPTPDADAAVDFAQSNCSKLGTRTRYGYAATFCAGFTVDGVSKFDLQNKTTTSYYYGPGVFGGESMFVPYNSSGGHTLAEDDGWLMSFVYGEGLNCESALEVVDAKTMTLVVRIAVPARVPSGFHALWLPSV
jgi:carotenoid cleavage dioxygenase